MTKNGIIAFCGSKGSGKSTSAVLLKKVFIGETEELAIAGHLKQTCSEVFGLNQELFINPSLKELELEDPIVLDAANIEAVFRQFFVQNYNFNSHVRPHISKILTTPRKLLQYIGTEVLHPIDPLIHIRATMQKKDQSKLTILTDLRFVNEFEFLTENFNDSFLPVYVRNPTAEIAASVDAHPSERQFELFRNACTVLDNTESMGALESKLKTLITEKYEQD